MTELFPTKVFLDKEKIKKKKYLADLIREYFYQVLVPSIEYQVDGYTVKNISMTPDAFSKSHSLIGHALGKILVESQPITIEVICTEIIHMIDDEYYDIKSEIGPNRWVKAMRYLRKHPVKNELMRI